MIVQFAGILIATFSLSPVQIYQTGQHGAGPVNPVAEVIYYLVSVAVFSVLIIAMLRLYRNKGDFLFRIVEAIAVGFRTGAMFFLILATETR